jgi:hypothetical protein
MLMKEIARSIVKLSEDRFVIVSFSHNRAYEKSLLPSFDNVIEISNKDGIEFDIKEGSRAKRELSRISLCEQELCLVPEK